MKARCKVLSNKTSPRFLAFIGVKIYSLKPLKIEGSNLALLNGNIYISIIDGNLGKVSFDSTYNGLSYDI